MPGRAIINNFIKSSEAGKKKPYSCPYHCISTCEYKTSPYCIALALLNAKKGHFKNGFAFAGVNAFRSTTIVSVKDLIETLEKEYDEAQSIEA
jgi:NAD(P)H-dependent flavin oxidoreductase YrpB (nitropropane dioxygenase family)